MSKVALLVSSLRGGGAERIFLYLSSYFDKLGHDVDLLLPKKEGAYLSSVPEGIRVIDLKANLSVYTSLFSILNYIRKEKPDAMFSTLTHINLLAIAAKKCSSTPFRLVIREPSTIETRIRTTKNLRDRFFVFLMKYFYIWSDGIVAISRGVADDISRTTNIPLSHIRVIYNPAVSPDIKKMAKEPVIHSWYFPNAPPVILGVGSLTLPKDFPTLIRAFNIVQKQRPARLVILGEGEERSNLEKLISDLGLHDHVSLPGFVENPFSYMAKSAVFVFSSAWEGFGNVLVEAMALGTPVVSTDCPSGPSEILDNGLYGSLVPVGDEHKIAEAIIKNLDHPPDKKRLIFRSSVFTMERIGPQYCDILELSDNML